MPDSERLTGDVTVDDGAPDLKNKKGECAPRHGDAIADFYFQKKNEFACPNNR